ncbi:MAG: DUF4190 domain-containing protein [Planctomycetota bacterium]
MRVPGEVVDAERVDSSQYPAAPPRPSGEPVPSGRIATPRPPQQIETNGPGRRYGFNCQYCSSRLEANSAMAGQEGHCPTCGNTIIIPILDRYGRLIDPMTGKVIKQDPHPVHAYAAAGERAPSIERLADGSQQIRCPRCDAPNTISGNNCKNCGMPFTMEGTTIEAAGANNGFSTAALVLGIVGLPTFCTGIVPLLAIIFGVIGLRQAGAEGGGRGLAIAGIVLGTVGVGLAMLLWTN